jgi:hypothetical protein
MPARDAANIRAGQGMARAAGRGPAHSRLASSVRIIPRSLFGATVIGLAPYRIMTVLTCLALISGCSSVQTMQRTMVEPSQPQTVDKKSPFLKAHMRDGSVYVLSPWSIDTIGRRVIGRGSRLDVNRVSEAASEQSIPIDSVALFETNVVKPHPTVGALTVVTGVSLAITALCLANTKACFGSCPTFYVSDGERPLLQAEGFSASVAPALEATDIDALYQARPTSRAFEVRMTNEALETHVVRWVHVLAAPRLDRGRTFATQSGQFWQASTIVPPQRCMAPEGDCLSALSAVDGTERFSTADSTDLAAREIIELEFPTPSGDTLGLVIASRQTLLSTYVLYQALAYMGRSAGTWLAALQRGDERTRTQSASLGRLLGGIEVQALDSSGVWISVGETQETGPLATDVRVVPLPHLPAGATRLRLRLTRGHWRLDHVALAQLSGRVEPLRLDPVFVRRDGADDANALALLRDSSRVLTTLPGDALTLVYELPRDFARYELFLEARGYYLEWMREEWMREENSARAAMMFLEPALALRILATEFKRQEAEMEKAFWGSRYVRH